MEAFGLLLHGFSVLLTFKTLAFMIVGLVLGIFVGVLPGLGGPNGVAILLPLTFTMDPTTAIVMLTTAPKRQIRTKVRRTEKAARPQRYAGQAQTVSIDRKIYGLNQ